MIAAWIGYALVVGTLVAAAARGVEGVWRLGGRPARWVWAGALALTLALVAAAPLRTAPTSRLRATGPVVSVERVAQPTAQPAGPFATALATLRRATSVVGEPVERALVAAGRRAPSALDRALAAAWAVASALLLALFGLVHWRIRQARRRWPAVELRGVPVRVAPAAGPAVVGLSHPEIVVPRWLLALAPEAQQLVLVHEREHVRARDPLLLAAGCTAAALLPWHPAAWWMLARLRLAVELDCDARVLRRGARPREYGSLLIDLAGRGAGLAVGTPIGAAALAGTPSHLERRLLAMTPQHSRFIAARRGALAAAALAVLAAACETKMPTAAEVKNMDVASAEGGARKMLLITGDSAAAYFVDGRQVTAVDARALTPEQIAQIQVLRTRHAAGATVATAGASEVRIYTRTPAGDSAAKHAGLHEGLVRRSADAQGEAPQTFTRIVVRDSAAGGAHFSTEARDGQVVNQSFSGLILIDGVKADAAAMRGLTPDAIESVNVIKGDAAAKLSSDPAAVNGIIKITTKAGAGR